jgi:hypothetical protein
VLVDRCRGLRSRPLSLARNWPSCPESSVTLVSKVPRAKINFDDSAFTGTYPKNWPEVDSQAASIR